MPEFETRTHFLCMRWTATGILPEWTSKLVKRSPESPASGRQSYPRGIVNRRLVAAPSIVIGGRHFSTEPVVSDHQFGAKSHCQKALSSCVWGFLAFHVPSILFSFQVLLFRLITIFPRNWKQPRMDVADVNVGQLRVKDEVGTRCQKLFQDFLEE